MSGKWSANGRSQERPFALIFCGQMDVDLIDEKGNLDRTSSYKENDLSHFSFIRKKIKAFFKRWNWAWESSFCTG